MLNLKTEQIFINIHIEFFTGSYDCRMKKRRVCWLFWKHFKKLGLLEGKKSAITDIIKVYQYPVIHVRKFNSNILLLG